MTGNWFYFRTKFKNIPPKQVEKFKLVALVVKQAVEKNSKIHLFVNMLVMLGGRIWHSLNSVYVAQKKR
jgi:hypothetical protein